MNFACESLRLRVQVTRQINLTGFTIKVANLSGTDAKAIIIMGHAALFKPQKSPGKKLKSALAAWRRNTGASVEAAGLN